MKAVNELYRTDHPRNYHSGCVPCERLFARQFMPFRQFVSAVAMVPHKTALVTEDGSLTFSELDELTRKLASGLLALGLRRGEAVACLLGNHWHLLPLFLAVARVGGIFMVANRYLARAEILFQLEETEPRLLVGDYGVTIDDILACATDAAVEPFNDEHAGLFIRFSSGTTGRPKMMIASHRAQASQFALCAVEMQLDDLDVHYCVGSLAHAAMLFALAQLFVGGTVFMKEKFDKESFWDECAANGITNTVVVPTMISSALEYPGQAPSLRAITSLGASLRPHLKERLLGRFPQLGLYEMYGASEFGMATCLRPHEQMQKPASVGRPCLGLDVRIFNDEGNPVPNGEIGTIYTRGVSQVDGVIGSEKPTPPPARLMAAGWSTCGDLGWYDQDGYLYISDRRVDLILSGGFNVYPAEVETVVCQAPGVLNAAVIGIEDERWGQRVIAYVEGDADQSDILARCKEMLARYKVPQAVHCVDELPRTSTGKISRKLVRDAVAEGKFPR